MITPEFNLLDEPWIRVVGPDCKEQEVSLTDALVRAHEFEGLCGELATQDVAVLRLLLAVLHTVWSRVNENGEEAPIESAQDALKRWKALWKLKKFPDSPIRDYLEQWHERFWLFHGERPFGQVTAASCGTEYGAAKLNGDLSESANKLRLFTERNGYAKENLSYAEAARWLLNLNGYDDTSAKPKEKGLPSPGTGWLGKLGLIAAKGNNLFETLLLNLVYRPDSNAQQPAWELQDAHAAERTEIALPENLAQLYTLQSRRIILCRTAGRVTGYHLLGGDFFQRENSLIEPMTVWRTVENKGKKVLNYVPKRHTAGEQMWREFGTLFLTQIGKQRPGIVSWVEDLRKHHCIDQKKYIRFDIAAVLYGDKDFFVNDAFSDSISFHADLLAEAGAAWRDRITKEIERCDQLAWCTGRLSDDLAKAAGNDGGSGQTERVRAQLYDRFDLPFRKWLYDLDPNTAGSKMEKFIEGWRDTARDITLRLGQELVSATGKNAFLGRYLMEGPPKKKSSVHYSSADAYNHFCGTVSKIESREGLPWRKK